ncbi:peptidoglycan D,D-transpeptidase FtsI family protein [Sulfuriferula thiophila]|uniref:peptidoglycan D,D-transpeptidase FtsI family protein n=1 Tax=Sulfuriferula thiophila TaxID=1781211 RepID=UPI001CB8E565|nr:penicillin-binding protein 2 [Sulfuriferula thiophila]
MSRIATRPTSHLLELHLQQWRGRLVLGLILAGFLVLAGRAVYLQGLHHDFLQRKGDALASRVVELPAHRGMIADRNGEPLAISTPVESLWANPSSVEVSASQLKQLATVLQMPVAELKGKLAQKDREFVYIKRRLPPDQAEAVAKLGISGMSLQREYRRYYPAGEVAAHLLGFTGIDDSGQEGMELAYQSWLAGIPGSRRVLKDRKGNVFEDVEGIMSPKPGHDLVLSIDMRLQYLAYRELQAAVLANKAKAGAIVVLDAKTGEILALANVPSFNPNNREGVKPWQMRNHAVTDEYEPGSTMKPFTVAAAMDTGKYKPDTLIDTENGSYQIGPKRIRDAHPHGMLTVSQVIQKSSNVGASKMALSMSPEYMWTELHNAGFGTVPRVGFPGAASGSLRPYQHWRPIEQATMSYGNGISVSLLQLARAYTVFTNHGVMKPVTMLKQTGAGPAGVRVFSAQSADALIPMLESVITPEGTAPQAALDGYRVAGKTGTAHKPDRGGYSADKYIASFIGFAPASNPRLIIAVMVDEPSAGQYYGGTVSAPVFKKVMQSALRQMDVAPDKPIVHQSLPTTVVGEDEST